MSTVSSAAQPRVESGKAEIRRALIIDDDEDYRKLLGMKLGRAFPHLIINEIDPLRTPLPDAEFNWDNIDFIILDYNLGIDITGLDWFRKFKSEELPATILLTARGSEELAVTAMKIGIDDYIVKEHFENEQLTNSIVECVGRKRREKERRFTLSRQSVVFNKPNFIHRLQMITKGRDANHHLLMINPVAYQDIGQERGLHYQDSYVRHIADCIFEQLSPHRISFNIFVYREEYVALILEASSYKKYLEEIRARLNREKFTIGLKEYPCAVNVGVISPQSLEAGELDKSDFELLSIAMVLCNSAKSDENREICNYGEIDLGEVTSPGIDPAQKLQTFDLETAIADGRVTANYQPWIYVKSDDDAAVRSIYDVRIEFIDTRGNAISQNALVKLLDSAYARRVVDKWVLRNSLRRLKDLPETDNPENQIRLAVKISLSSVADPAFVEWTMELLHGAELPPGRLLMEFEASQIVRDPENYRVLINQIGSDFGIRTIVSGITDIDKYHDARKLQRFDFVKLNVSKLTFGMPRWPVRALIQGIRDEGSKVVAVYVADAEMLAMATEMNVDYMHGYLIGRPNTDIIADSDGDLHCVI
jgi:EAL domain-containing protein (putative c-di-GMP-specific phosphodiesterase class I)/ActR/RegA family two-component response regulator